MDFNSSSPYPEGVISFLDTDLYKLTMQCAVLKYYKDVPVTYAFTNRTPEKKLSRKAFSWLEEQIRSMTPLEVTCVMASLTLLQHRARKHISIDRRATILEDALPVPNTNLP
jgi:nicotinic acid phosphoribosyltransferase